MPPTEIVGTRAGPIRQGVTPPVEGLPNYPTETREVNKAMRVRVVSQRGRTRGVLKRRGSNKWREVTAKDGDIIVID